MTPRQKYLVARAGWICYFTILADMAWDRIGWWALFFAAAATALSVVMATGLVVLLRGKGDVR